MQSKGEPDEPIAAKTGATPAGEPAPGAFAPAEQRLLRLMGEFRRRQWERPNLVVRPWLSEAREAPEEPGVGFVIEYCPRGDASAELRVRWNRAVAEGPAGAREAAICLATGWRYDGADVRGPELMANHLLRLAEATLG